MRAFLAIARREIAERRQVLAAAAVAGLVPLLAPALRGLAGAEAARVRSWAALGIATAFGLGLTVALGASMLVPRIASRKIGFDFTRPVSEGTIWAACLAAAGALAAACAGVAYLPAWLIGARPAVSELLLEPAPTRLWLLAVLLGPLALFALVHCATLALRSRSPLIALDAALALVAWLGVSAALARLPSFLAPLPAAAVKLGVLGAIGLAGLAAGHASIARGRTDIAAAHRAASSRFWLVVALALVLANAYAVWVMAAKPADLVATGFWVRPADTGPWVEVSGEVRGAHASFLSNTRDRRFARTRTVDWRDPVFSHDGNLAAWVEGRERGATRRLWTWRLADAGANPAPTRLSFDGYPALLELSPDGSRLAAWENGALSLHDVAAERTLASARVHVADREELRGLFVGPDTFRLYRVGDHSIEILQLDAGTRMLERLGKIEGTIGRYFVTDDAGTRLVKLDGPNNRIRLYDGATGSLVATLADEPAASRWPSWLPDGRIVVVERLESGWRLHAFDADGREQSSVPLPPALQVMRGGEIAPGQLVLGITDERGRHSLLLVDLQAASLRKVADDLRPLWTFGSAPALGSDAARLFYGPGGRSLVRFDPITGQRQEILGANR